MAEGKAITINGDGETSRDFCFVANVVQANLLAATCSHYDAGQSAFNIALGDRTTLNELQQYLRELLMKAGLPEPPPPIYGPERPGDVRHSQADISRARGLLGFQPGYHVQAGLEVTVEALVRNRVSLPNGI